MAEIIRMPRLSDTMEEGVIVGWLKEIGDEIEPGDILAEVETDKATMELESYQEGVLLHIMIKEGPVPVEAPVAILGEKGEDIATLLKELESESTGEKPAESPKEEPAAEKAAPTVETKTSPAVSPAAPDNNKTEDGRIKASPLAKKIASEKGLDLQYVTGTGDGGRIVKKDVEKAIETGVGAPATTSTSTGSIQIATGEDKTIPVSQMRKIIARRLGESKFTSPHFYVTVEIDMDNAIAARKSINEGEEESKISFNDIVIKAVAVSLRKHPMVNASWQGDQIVMHGDINIGVAVAVDEGLLVPVIRNADYKSLTEIKSEIVDKAGKARNKKLQPDEMQGNTFTISNLGMFGVEEFTAIINPPDACILAVGTIVKKPVVKNNQIVIGNTMKVTLSCDHRIVDGALGAQFLQTLRSYLENPMKLLR